MEKFTKTGWHVCDGVFVYALNERGTNAFQLSVGGNGNRGASQDELKANAALIAAAPEMYDALKRAKEMYENIIEYSGVNALYLVPISEEIDFIEDALAKARGEK